MRKEDLLSHLKNTMPTKGQSIDPVMQTVKALRESNVSERGWNPSKTTTKEIWKRWLMEANEIQNTDRRAAFRLNLQPIAMDQGIIKFTFLRNGATVTVNIMYPDKDGNIGIRVSMPGANDNMKAIDTDEPGYINGLGYEIVKMADEIIENKNIQSSMGGGSADLDTYSLGGASVGGYSPNWENNSTRWESDIGAFNNLMSLVEEELPKPEDTDAPDADAGANANDVNEMGGPNDQLGADAFSADGGDDLGDLGGDLGGGGGGFGGGGGGGGGFGGGGGDMGGGDAGAPGAQEPAVDTEFTIFGDYLKDPVGNGIRNGFGEEQKGLAQGLSIILKKAMDKQMSSLPRWAKENVDNGLKMQDLKGFLIPEFLKAMEGTALADDSREIPVDVAQTIVDKIIDSPDDFLNWYTVDGVKAIDGDDSSMTLDSGDMFNQEYQPQGADQGADMGGGQGTDMGGEQGGMDELFGDITSPTTANGLPPIGEEETTPDELQAENEVTQDMGQPSNEFPQT